MDASVRTVGDIRRANGFSAICLPVCFRGDDEVVTNVDLRCAQAALACWVLFFTFRGIPGLIENRKFFLIGAGSGFGLGVLAGSLNGYSLTKINPESNCLTVLAPIAEVHAAKKTVVKVIFIGALLSVIILRSIPPYRDSSPFAAFFDGMFPGYILGYTVSYLIAQQIVKHLLKRGLDINELSPEERRLIGEQLFETPQRIDEV